ncbi:MetQ/NlpA family ABC transporter substrate-binding protein [Actinomadura atramentaria]|uniref:MetQ/NlpA family ABC transporter substrate-binding protein n=1 Tax=Actinomadura atramentaria TaxID=1990 RepID=UPI00035E68D6|nr:MetQ/NlpA family ABC transporter substrate-binding protein [Actinomadura atramentaria]
MLRKLTAVALSAGLLFGLAACGGSSDDDDTLTVGATSVPHAEILNYVKDNLAAKAGIKLEVKEFSEYEQLNPALADKQLDANYFQHKPYLDESNQKTGEKLVFVAGIHLEPLGVYSKKVKSLSELKQGATVSLPSDPTNEGRALKLLADNGLITLKDGAGQTATEKDVATNPKGIKFRPTDAASLPRQLGDVDASVINGNYALEARLNPAKDALVAEKTEGNPYVNGLVTRPGDENDPKIKKLVELLKSPEVKKFIEDKYQGSVIPA